MIDELDKSVGEAIKLFWKTRAKQSKKQGSVTGQKDAGLRAAVTGGKHLDGFSDIYCKLFLQAGLPEAHIYWQTKKELPGYYRAEKNWDLLTVVDGHLLAVIEFKAQVGPSFETTSTTEPRRPSAMQLTFGRHTVKVPSNHRRDPGWDTFSSWRIARRRGDQ